MRELTSTPVAHHRDEAELYRRHHSELVRSVARAVNASRELIEDACQTAWLILLRRQPEPEPESVFGRLLRKVAIHEAYRLSRTGAPRRTSRRPGRRWVGRAVPSRVAIGDAIEARRAWPSLAGLPDRQREYLELLVAGFSYREIGELAGGRTFTNVNKHLARAHTRVRREQSHLA